MHVLHVLFEENIRFVACVIRPIKKQTNSFIHEELHNDNALYG